MQTEFALALNERQPKVKNIGKKSLRRNFIPGVLYGRQQTSKSIQVDRHDFERMFPNLKPNSLITIELNGEKKTTYLKDYSINLRKRRMNHIDLLVVEEDTEVTIPVPIEVVGISKGVLKGGVMRIAQPHITLKGLVKLVPKTIKVDVGELDIGQHFSVKDIDLEKGLSFALSARQVLISILSARGSGEPTPSEGTDQATTTTDDSKATENDDKKEG